MLIARQRNIFILKIRTNLIFRKNHLIGFEGINLAVNPCFGHDKHNDGVILNSRHQRNMNLASTGPFGIRTFLPGTAMWSTLSELPVIKMVLKIFRIAKWLVLLR